MLTVQQQHRLASTSMEKCMFQGNPVKYPELAIEKYTLQLLPSNPDG